jgi:hypothetical protein
MRIQILKVRLIFIFLLCILSAIFIDGCSPTNIYLGDKPSSKPLTPQPTLQALPTPFPLNQIKLYFAGEVPAGLIQAITLPAEVELVETRGEANVVLDRAVGEGNSSIPEITWHYMVVAPFPRGLVKPDLSCDNLFASADTFAAFSGTSASAFDCESFVPSGGEDLLSTVGKTENSFALIPFEELSKSWQLRTGEGIKEEGETVKFTLSGDQAAIDSLFKNKDFLIPKTNFDPQKLASVILTGTTALTRGTGRLMDENGSLYPAENIGELLRSADVTHISNEISFDPNCKLESSGTRFCSKDEYFDLLNSIGTDVIELTGNHEMDYGSGPFLHSLDLYTQSNIPYYGGGRDLKEAAKPLKMVVKGNRIAFLGCNSVGPKYDLAEEGSPGSNPCDTERMRQTIIELRNEGYNPIVTFQHMEVCQADPVSPQRGDFQRAANAGAVIVSGSQGHCPQVMEFFGYSVIHYGLGNLFFDQMDKIERLAFIDRYWFYDNRLIGVDPIAIIRDDEAQPRIMTPEESAWFLERYLPPLAGN